MLLIVVNTAPMKMRRASVLSELGADLEGD
jgi:hypothetical protein